MKYFTLIICITLALPSLGQSYSLKRSPHNGPASDFSAVKTGGQSVVWVSNRRTEGLAVKKDAQGNFPSNLLLAGTGENNQSSFSDEINSSDNEGPFCFSADESELFFTGTMDGKGGNKDYLGIFYSRKVNGTWQEPVSLPFNDAVGVYNVAHPSLTKDGSRLYFASDMPGTIGKSDIFYVDKIGDAWSAPTPLPAPVNTPGKESFPFIHPSGVLYYATNHYSGGKDFDIYRCDLLSPVMKTERLPEPLNGKSSDFAYWSDERDETGFISSDRDGARDQVFEFAYIYPEPSGCPESVEMELCFRISETEIVPVDSLPFKFEWDFGDSTTAIGLSNLHCFPKEGIYHVVLNIYDTLTNSVFAQVSESDILIEKPYAPFILITDAPEGYQAEGRTDYLEGFDPMKYHWKIGTDRFERGSKVFIPRNADSVQISLMVSGVWPDGQQAEFCAVRTIRSLKNKPSDAELQANQVMANYDGRDNNGANNEKAGNQRTDIDESDNDVADHDGPVEVNASASEELMYFVEFHVSEASVPLDAPLFSKITYPITEREDDDLKFHYSVGVADDPFELYPIVSDLRSIGFTTPIVRDEPIREFAASITQGGIIEKGSEEEINDFFENFSNIQFDVNSEQISRESFENLDYIVRTLTRRNDLGLHITAHTDGDGSAEYNMELSQRRAKCVLNYFLNKGIVPERLSWEGKGEAEPIADNLNEKGRKKNRRVEFEVRVMNN
jgi:outer membrane protein OmpA-like peptidoglycan-associated protein